jgi:hypothetical protein
MAEILTHDELESLTGSKLKKQQIETLRAQGITFLLDRSGRPVVIWDAVRVAISRQQEQSNAPNFEALTRAPKAAQR